MLFELKICPHSVVQSRIEVASHLHQMTLMFCKIRSMTFKSFQLHDDCTCLLNPSQFTFGFIVCFWFQTIIRRRPFRVCCHYSVCCRIHIVECRFTVLLMVVQYLHTNAKILQKRLCVINIIGNSIPVEIRVREKVLQITLRFIFF